MLVINLEAVGVPAQGITLIHGVYRILDMLRTVVNGTRDATVATIVTASQDQLDLVVAGFPATAAVEEHCFGS